MKSTRKSGSFGEPHKWFEMYARIEKKTYSRGNKDSPQTDAI